MTPPAPSSACATWRRRLAEAESAIAGAPTRDAPNLQLGALHDHMDACPSCRRSHGSRLSNLEAQLALRSRSVPDGLFDGFYERLEREACMAPLGGGMSLAFLDAPRALHLWRMAALSTGLLLLVGVAWVSMHGVGPRTSMGSPLDTSPDGPAAWLVAWPEASSPRAPGRGIQVRPAQAWGEAAPSEAVPSEAVPSEAVPSEAVPSEAAPWSDDFYRERHPATPPRVVAPSRSLRSSSSDLRRD